MFNWRKPIIFALLYLSGSKIPQNLKEIRRVDNLPIEEQKAYQKKKLEKLLSYAWENVPYYKKVGRTLHQDWRMTPELKSAQLCLFYFSLILAHGFDNKL